MPSRSARTTAPSPRRWLRPRSVALTALVAPGRRRLAPKIVSRHAAMLRRLREGNYVAFGAYVGHLPKMNVTLGDDDRVVRARWQDGRAMTIAEAQAAVGALIFDDARQYPESQLARLLRQHLAQRAAENAQRTSVVRPPTRSLPRPRLRRAQPRRRRVARRATRPTARAPDPEPPSAAHFDDFELLNGVPP